MAIISCAPGNKLADQSFARISVEFCCHKMAADNSWSSSISSHFGAMAPRGGSTPYLLLDLAPATGAGKAGAARGLNRAVRGITKTAGKE